MKKLLLLLVISSFFTLQSALANRYYWVGNGGNWTDVSHHWATTTGGSTMQLSIPGAADSVYFDANSFTLSDQSVYLDTLIGECAMMDWSGLSIATEFISGYTARLTIHGSCILSTNLTFNFQGRLIIAAASPIIARIDTKDFILKCDAQFASDSAVLMSGLYLPYNHLSVVDGSVNTNGHNVSCKHFNTDTTYKASVTVTNPHWYCNDTLTVCGSMAVSGLMGFHQNGPLYLDFNTTDTNYLNMYTTLIPGKVFVNGGRKMYLLSQFSMLGDLDFTSSVYFYTRGFPVTAASISSNNSMVRTINLSSSVVTIKNANNALYLNSRGLRLISDSAKIFFTYAGADTVEVSFGKDSVYRFKEVHLPSSDAMLYNSFTTALLAFDSATTVAFARGITVRVSNITSLGDCGAYNYIKAFCLECPSCDFDYTCDTTRPVFRSTVPITTSYLKIKNIKASGAAFTANNSFDEGNNVGWTINEPVAASTMYWINGSGNWNDSHHWSTTSGGPAGSCIPNRATNVVFNAASAAGAFTVTLKGNAYCQKMTWSGITGIGTVTGTGAIYISDSVQLQSLTKLTPSAGLVLTSSVNEVHTFRSNAADINCNILIDGQPQWVLSDSLYVDGKITLAAGTFDLNGNPLRCNSLLAGGSKMRTLNYSNSRIYLYGNDSVWNSSGSNLTLTHNSGSVRLTNASTDFVMVKASGKSFDTIRIMSPKTKIAGGINCRLIALNAGSLLECEPLYTIKFDSIIASASCTNPIILSNYSGSADTAIFELNTTNDSILIDNVILRNVCANNSSSRKYYVQNAIGINKYSGWSFIGSGTIKTYYWTGLISNKWSQPGNWEVSGLPATCLPSPIDTVIFNKTHLAAPGSHDTVIIEQNAYCNAMIWSDSIVGKPAMILGSDLTASGSVTLCDSLSLSYTSAYQSTDADAPQMILAPQIGNTSLDPVCKEFGVNLSIQGRSLTDTVKLLNPLTLDTLNALTFVSGTFSSNGKNIYAGIISSAGNTVKRAYLANSNITVAYNFNVQSSTYFKLYMNASKLVMEDNPSFHDAFDGGGQLYAQVEFKCRATGLNGVYYSASIKSSNHFGLLKINPGLHMQFQAGSTQTLDSIIMRASCRDSIYLRSSNIGATATLNKPVGDSIRGVCLNVRDIAATKGASAVFSTNVQNNTKWFFKAANPTNASFSLPPTSCYNDSTHFTNTSTAYSGSQNDLEFHWSFGDTDSSTLVSPSHLYSFYTSYVVSLRSIDTLTGCLDDFTDTITIYKADVNLSSTESDLTLCAGDTVKFMANSVNPSPDYLFMMAGNPIIQSPDSTHFSTSALANGDEVYVILTYMGCVDTSARYTYTVNPLPLVHLSSIPTDTTICDGDSIHFIASGANKYQLYLNGSTSGGFNTNNQWSFTDAVNGDSFTVYGQNTVTGCSANSSDVLTVKVNPLPIVNLVCSDPSLTICSGNTLNFTASGSSFYQFFLNGDSLGASSPLNTLSLSTLQNDDVLTVEGTSAYGCQAMSSDALEITVNPTPVVTLSISDPDGIICAGENVTYQASGADTYQFYVNGDSTGAFDFANSFSTSGLVDGDAVTVSGILGTCPAAADTTMIIDVRPTITWGHTSLQICASDTITFVSHGDSQYQYFVDGSSVTTLGPDSVYHAVGLSNGQLVTVGGSAGACTPSGLNVTIYPLPTPTISCSDADTAICQGDILTFTASGAEQFAYYLNGVQLAPFSGINVYATDTAHNGDIITMQGLSTYGCLNTSANIYTVEVHPYPVVSLNQSDADQIICAGDTVIFTAGGASNYQFFVNGASQGASAPVNTFTTSMLPNNALVTVNGTSGICTSTSSTFYNYVVNPLPIIGFSPITPLNYCNGDTLQLLATGATSYEYFVDGISTGAPTGNNIFTSTSLNSGETISVTGWLTGCQSNADTTYTVTVNAYPTLVFTANASDLDVCFGDTLMFDGNGAQNYIYYLDGIPVSSDSVFITSDLEQGQEIILTGGNGVCWKQADTIFHFNVHYVDVQLSSSQPSGIICSGDPITFTATGADTYQFFVDGVSAGAASATATFTPATINNGQLVSVVGSSIANGCSQQALSNILTHVYPVPQITSTPSTTFCEGDSATLESNVNDGLSWYLNGSILSGMEDSLLVVHESGDYQVASTLGGTGVCLSTGANNFGQLGNASLANALAFREASGLEGLTAIACGYEFTLALVDDGSVMAWGRNEFGALGTGNFTDSDIPVAVGSINNAIGIAAGKRHGMALLQDSTVLAWGDNTLGQLGLGNFFTSNFPFSVTGLSGIVDIAAGDNFCLALDHTGHVWAWGQNQYGQLGDGTVITSNIPVMVAGLDSVVELAAGGNHSMAIKRDGTLWVWGANNAGQLANWQLCWKQSSCKGSATL